MSKQYPVRTMRPNLKSLLLATAAAVVAGAGPGAALAQQASGEPASGTVVGEVVVAGYRKSLIEARAIKKESVIEKDAIVAEDMAKFPELNLAESLQRLPGVQITREAGEGREIALRGLGPDFSRVQLNGMEVLGNNDSAMDSLGQRTRDRAFDFNIFASELFSKVEVEKTFEAAQNEGGMAGTVGLFTGKPFNYGEGFKGALTFKAGTNQYTKDFQPRIAALFSQNWDDKFGVAVSVAYAKRETTEQGHDNYNYDQIDSGELDASGNCAAIGRRRPGHLASDRRTAGQVPVRHPLYPGRQPHLLLGREVGAPRHHGRAAVEAGGKRAADARCVAQ